MRQGGYTLVELVVAVSITALLTATLAALQVSVFKARQAHREQGRRAGALRDGLEYIARDVAAATAVSAAGGEVALIVEGRSVRYRVSGGALRRDVEGAERAVARPVDRLQARRAGALVEVELVSGTLSAYTRAFPLAP